jgi:hypothetical protein
MERILETRFENGGLPSDWIEPMRTASVEEGILRSPSGAVLNIPIPGDGYETTLIEVDVEMGGGGLLTCSDGASAIVVDLKKGAHFINHSGPGLLGENRVLLPDSGGVIRVSFLFDRGLLRASAEGRELVAAADPNAFVASSIFDLGFWNDCRIHRIAVFGGGLSSAVTASTQEPIAFALEMNVDFFDDMVHAPWKEEMFFDLFAKFKSWGVKRCHWIYYGRRSEGWWDGAPLGVADHARRTMDNVGEIFPTAARAAHHHGIEIFGLIKPFDMGFAQHASPDASNASGLARIGGPVRWIADFPARHREWVIARKPGCFGEAQSTIFTRIDLVKEDADEAGFSVADVQLYISDDNQTYRLYEGPVSREEVIEDYPVWEHTSSGGRPTGNVRQSRVMRLNGLAISQKFVVVHVASRGRSFKNTLVNLIHIFGENGEERLVTYGIVARGGEHEITENVSAVTPEIDFRKYGVQFDLQPGTPSSLFPGYDPISAPYTLDAGDGLIAITAGKDDGTLAAMSPAFPEVRAWWLSWVQDCLNAGADGIELRVRNHHSHLTWGEFGFEAPVRDRFLALHGVDIWETDDFDKLEWARLRGEDYTTFCREARELAGKYGKPLGLHVSLTNNCGPQGSSAMNIHWDWRGWLAEGLADSITLKEIMPGTRFAREVMNCAAERSVSVIYAPYANDLWLRPKGEEICRQWIDLARRAGCAGYQFYECAAVIRGTKEGELKVSQPALAAVLREEFAPEPSLTESR